MNTTIYGYRSDNVGVLKYTDKLCKNLANQEDISCEEPPKLMYPGMLNQVLLNGIKLRTISSDLIHICNQDDLATFLFPKSLDFVVTIHDLFRYTEGDLFLDGFRGEKIVKNLKRANKVIAISEFTKGQILDNTKVSKEDINVIYQGVDLDDLYPEEGEIEYEKYILHVGTEINRKNIQGLIDIFCIYKENNPKAKLIRVGEPSKKTKKHIEKLDLELGKDVIYEQNISIKRLRALYTNAEKLAFPSHAEGFGRPIVESLACETPVIAFDRNPMNEILPKKMLVNPDQKERFAQKLSKNYNINCRKIASKFNWEKTAEKTYNVYKEAKK